MQQAAGQKAAKKKKKMLQYDNRGWALFLLLFRVEGSVLPQTYLVALIPAIIALFLEFAQHGDLGEAAQDMLHDAILNPFACQVYALVLGYFSSSLLFTFSFLLI